MCKNLADMNKRGGGSGQSVSSSGSGSSKPNGRDNDKLLNHLRSMQQMEKDTQETLGIS